MLEKYIINAKIDNLEESKYSVNYQENANIPLVYLNIDYKNLNISENDDYSLSIKINLK